MIWQNSLEKEDMRLRLMDLVVLPAKTLNENLVSAMSHVFFSLALWTAGDLRWKGKKKKKKKKKKGRDKTF